MKLNHPSKIRLIRYALFCGICLLISSCKSSKEATGNTMSEKNKNERLELMNKQALQYSTLSSSLKFSIKPGQKSKNTSADARLKIIKDQAIQLSLGTPFIYTELFRIIVSPDSLILIDRANKLYLAESLHTIKSRASFDFDFYNLQALFTNHLFIAGKSTVTPNDFPLLSVEQTQYNAVISSRDRQQIRYTFTSDYTNRIQSTEMVGKGESIRMLWTYDEFSATSDSQAFPMKMKMDLNLPKDIANMNLSFSNVEVNNDVQINFSIPTKYQRITLEQAIKIINNL